MKVYDRAEPINFGKFLADHGAKPKPQTGPFIVRDYYNGPLAYESPLTGRKIDSRFERAKEMKAHNVREVDPSESAFHRKEDRKYNSKAYARARGLKLYKED